MSDAIRPMWLHQVEGVRRACEHPYFAWLWQMGCGKSRVAIETLRTHFNREKRILRTLILSPPITLNNWSNEWKLYTKIDPSLVQVLSGTGKARVKKFLAGAFDSDGKPKGGVWVLNYESLLMPDLYEAFLRWRPEAVVYDESHKLKSPTAKRSKLAEALANPYDKKTKRALPKPLTYLLTGTPVLNSPMDLFMQFLILDGGATFGGNFFSFRARFMRDRNAGMARDKYFPDWVIRPGAVEEINSLIYHHAMRVSKEDCLDLPPLVQTTIKVGMTKEQARLYNEMKKDFIAVINDKACVATLAITKAQRLMQIASGFIKVVGDEEIPLEDTPKMEALKELLSDLAPHSKVIVWAVWRKNYGEIEKVCQALGLGYAQVFGGLTDSVRNENVRRFNEDPQCRVFIGNPLSGGIGINLVIAPYAIFYSRNFSLEESLQAEARNHRGGSEIHEKITRYDIVVENTIDELVCNKLANKLDMSMNVLRDLSLELKNQE